MKEVAKAMGRRRKDIVVRSEGRFNYENGERGHEIAQAGPARLQCATGADRRPFTRLPTIHYIASMTRSHSHFGAPPLAALSLLVSLCAFASNVHARVDDSGHRTLDSAVLMNDLKTLASPAMAGRLTGTAGNRAAQAYITGRFQQIGVQPFGAHYAMPFAFTPKASSAKPHEAASAQGVNLIGQIRGNRFPERYIVVSAHYDHLGTRNDAIYAGADDNASGVAAMLAVAAWFKRHPPQNTIVFAAFDAEEQGKRGAYAFVRKPPFPVAGLALNLNFDMVSRNDRNELYVAGIHHYPHLRAVVAAGALSSSVNVKLGHDNRAQAKVPQDDWTTESDHAAFHEAGIPFLYFGVEDHPDYHQPGDTFEKIEGAFFANVTRVLIRMASVADQNLDQVRQPQ